MQSKPTVLAYYDAESTGAVEFRRLAGNVRHRGNPKANAEVKSIMVTSATKHEGKSLIAANLAIAIARRENDKKVLLIDCDLRRPMIHSLFGMEREPGFASLLAGESEPNDVAHDTELGNLKVIPVGSFVDPPSEVLASAKDALYRCTSGGDPPGRPFCDILICDAPPVVPVDDVGILGPHVDGVLLVVLAGKTDRMVVKRAIDILHDVNAEILGIVLNNLHGVLPYYYDHKYYRYRYKRAEAPREST
jgi:capsular exopolysaccharide synthesis family protein